MTQPPLPNPENEPEFNDNSREQPSPPIRPRRRRWLWVGLSVLAVTGGGLTAGWFALKHYLSPILSNILSEQLDRPLNVGQVNYLSLTGIRFGETEIPATPTDSDRATVEAVNVLFNPLKLLTDKTLELHVTLINPNAYIEQDVNGEWIATRLKERGKESQWKVEVRTIRAQNAKVVLVARGQNAQLKPPVELGVSQATVRTYEDYELFEGEAKGSFVGGGRFDVAGSLRPEPFEAKVNLATQQLNLPYLSRLVEIPIIVQTGSLGTNLEIAFKGDPRKELPVVRGIATLQNLSATVDEKALGLDEPQTRAIQKRQQQPREIEERSPFYFLNNLPIAIPDVKQTNGRFTFQGQKVRIDTLTTQLGQINATVRGTLDRESGFNLAATTKPVTIANLLKTFELKQPPVPVAGEFKVALQAVGPFDKPIITSNLVATRPFRLDKVNFRSVQAKLAFSFANLTLVLQELQAIPVAGGKVTGTGRVRFNREQDPGRIALNFQTENIPGDAIASLYLKNLPITIGPVSLQAQVFGPLTKIEDLQARVFGNLLGGGTISARNVQLKDGRFSGTVLASGLQLNRILPANSPLRSEVGTANALFDIAGPVENFSLNRLSATGSLTATVAGGTVTARNLQLNNGRFETQLLASGVQVGRIAPKVLPANLSLPPLGSLNGAFQVAGRLGGNTAGLPVEGLNGTGSLTVAVAGGTVEARGIELTGDRWQARVAANGVETSRLASILSLPPTLRPLQQAIGAFSGNFQAAGSLNSFNLNTLTASGTGRVNVAGGTANIAVNLNRGNLLADIAPNGVQLTRLTAGLDLPAALARGQQALGAFTGNLRVRSNLSSFNLNTLTASGTGRLNAAGGTADVDFNLNQGNWFADIDASGVQLTRFTAGLNLPAALARSQQTLGAFTGNLRAAGDLSSFDPETLTASSRGRVNLAGGTANIALDLSQGNWLANITASGVQPQRLIAGIPAQFQSPVSGNLNLRGTLSDLSLNAIMARGSGSLNLAGGEIAANNLRLANGNLQATLVPNNIQLDRLVAGLNGSVDGNIDVTANLANLTPEGIRASGRVNLSDGVLPLDGPVAATFNWNGDRLAIDRATGQGLDASGFVNVNTAALRRGQIGLNLIEQFNFDVSLRGLNLQQLSEQGKTLIAWPANVASVVNQTEVAGLADFTGNVRGTLRSPQIDGTLALRDARFNEFTLDPVVSGPVAFTPGQGGSLRLAGQNDRIELALGADYKPNSFLVQIDDLFATGTRQGELLAVNVRNFPLAYVQRSLPPGLIPANLAAQPLSGQLSGDFNINLNTLAASGRIDVANPILSRIGGDRFTASFQYANGSAVINDATFQQGETQYVLDARVVQTARGPQFNAEVEVREGRIQDILATAQIFNIADFTKLLQLPVYGNANNLQTVSIDIANLPLISQLRRLSEVEALLEQRRRERLAASPLPPLSEATGAVSGQINVSGSLAEGIEVAFDFAGSDWVWGPFVANQTIAQGSFQDGVLTVRPFQMQLANGGEISFAGSIGGETQTGQLRVEQLPVALVQEFVALPPDIGFTGFINATAVLSGTQQNPQARGQLTVVDATLNQQTVESTQGSFSYNEGILNFAVNSTIAAGTEPLAIAGKFPYKFPFPNAVPPTSDVFELTLNLKNNGLSILNALTRQQLIWKDGQGDVNLAIGGRYDQEENRLLDLKADGVVNLQNAEVASLLLADSLTNINGQILFDFDKITVPSLSSQFGGGNLTVAGSLALTEPAAQENPLTINLNELAVNLKGLYNGDVGGNLQVRGALLQPELSGQLELTDGRVLIAGLATFGRGQFIGTGTGDRGPGAIGQIVAATEFNNLELILGNNLRLEQPLLVNFGADGSILLNGQVGSFAPQGIVRLVNGQINLFTTQLRLRGGYDNVAIFRPEYGLNPRLDLRLVGSVVESSRTQTTAEPFSSEIRESLVNFGTIETIRVEAIVNGFALDLLESLRVEPGVSSAQRVRSVIELTSTPPRSETQIIALLGGGFINAFSQDNAGLGLANLASNALFGSIQNALANSLGLSEFRIFPSVVPNTDDRTSTFGLAAELGYNITDDLGVSVTQFLTPQVPTQVNLRYRINDYLLLRGSTNFGNENRVQIEYRQRF